MKLSILSALAALLTGCGTSPKIAIPPEKAGTSVPLKYPVLLLGMEVPDITVMDSEDRLTTTTKASGLNLPSHHVIDSSGGLFEVKSSTPVGHVASGWSDMVGNQPFRIFLEMKMLRRVDVEKAREMVIETVRNPRIQLSKPAYLASAEAAIRSYRTLPALIEGCKYTNEWY